MVKLERLSLVYPPAPSEGRIKALDGIDMTINKKESIALIGENGAGKTTFLLAIAGILEPENGTIEIDGIRLNKKTINEVRKKTGLVFQNPDDQLFMPLIYDDVAFGCRNSGMPEEIVRMRVDETLKQLNIMHLRSRSPLKLSGGEKRMAALAAVLVMEPSLLLFDEPTAFLDPKARRSLIKIFMNLEHTKIVATHDLAFAAGVCRRVVVLKDGRIAADGEISLLYDKELMANCGLEAIEAR